MAEYDWLLGIGIVFGLSLFLMVTGNQSLKSFITYMMIADGFVVSAGLLDVWTLILLLLINGYIFYGDVKKSRGTLGGGF